MAFHNRVTSRNVELSHARRRQQEQKDNSLRQFADSNQIHRTQQQSEACVSYKRRVNQRIQYTTEKMLEDAHAEQKEQQTRRAFEKQQNELLAQTLSSEMRAKEKHEREIQRICESSEEIRALQSLLSTAYMNKDRATQQLERTILIQQDKHRNSAMEQQMEYDRQRSLIQAQNQETQRHNEAKKANIILKQQMLQRLEQEKEQQLQIQSEKDQIEKLMQTIELEDMEEMERRRKLQQANRAQIEASQLARESFLSSRAEQERQETLAIEEYQRRVTARELEFQALQQRQKAANDAKFQAIEANIKAQMLAQLEMDMEEHVIYEEEMFQKHKLEEQTRKAAKLKAKEDMKHGNTMQLQHKHELRLAQKAEEEAFNAMLRTKFQSEARREMELSIFRRKQKEQYQIDILRQKMEKAEIVKEEMERESRERALIDKEEAYKRDIIEQAKEKLIRAHEEILKEYLPNALYK